jgi:endonuclease/exonuclease/phosphatase family metal-dependent hydrolase
VAVRLEESLTRPLLYVALSRSTTLNSLFLYGDSSILKKTYRSKEWTEEKRIAHALKEAEKNKVQIEMNRLKTTSVLENKFPFLGNDEHLYDFDLSIMFINIQSFNTYKNSLANDYGFKNADIILLGECHNVLVTREHAARVFQQTHDMVYFTSGTNEQSSCGQICFVRREKSNKLKLVADNANERGLYTQSNQRKMCELSLFEYIHSSSKKMMLLSVYKHPEYSANEFVKELATFLKTNLKDTHRPLSLYVVGDFNIDFNRTELSQIQAIVDTFENNFHLKPILSNRKTHRWLENGQMKFSQLDWAFRNESFRHQINASEYDTWFSDHEAIRAEIKF